VEAPEQYFTKKKKFKAFTATKLDKMFLGYELH
jgi:hypothetical protein